MGTTAVRRRRLRALDRRLLQIYPFYRQIAARLSGMLALVLGVAMFNRWTAPGTIRDIGVSGGVAVWIFLAAESYRKVAESNRDRREVPNIACLRHQDLSGRNLPLLRLRRRDMEGLYCNKSKLPGAVLIQSNLQDARFPESDLSYADLTGADCQDAYFHQTRLVEAKLDDVKARNASFERADLRDASLTGADLWGAKFKGADIRGADFTGATLAAWQLRRALSDESTVVPPGCELLPPVERGVVAATLAEASLVWTRRSVVVHRLAVGMVAAAAIGSVGYLSSMAERPSFEAAFESRGRGDDIVVVGKGAISSSDDTPRTRRVPTTRATVSTTPDTEAPASSTAPTTVATAVTTDISTDVAAVSSTVATVQPEAIEPDPEPTETVPAEVTSTVATSSNPDGTAVPDDAELVPVEVGPALVQQESTSSSPTTAAPVRDVRLVMGSQGGLASAIYRVGSDPGQVVVVDGQFEVPLNATSAGAFTVRIQPDSEAVVASCAIVVDGVEQDAKVGQAGQPVECGFSPG